MGRSALLAIGAVSAAAATEHIGVIQVGAAIALAMAALLVAGEVAPSKRARQGWPIVIGALLVAVRLMVFPTAVPPAGAPPEEFRAWSLVVISTGSPRDGHQTATLATPPENGAPFTVAATLPRFPEVMPGDRVFVEGQIRLPPASPYGEYLRRIGAAGTINARAMTIQPAPGDVGRHLEAIRRGAAEALARVLPEPEAGLAAGILIGLRDRVDRGLAADFTTAGVSHVVAISGWNIAIVAAAIAALAGRLRRRRRAIITVAAIVAYVCFAGASASVVRAAAMAGVVLLARETGRAGHAAAALGWAATLLLLSDPTLISDAGFQLSSLATAGLIAWATPLTARIDRLGRGHVPGWLTEGLGVSLAAQAATLPIVLASFGRLALLSPVVNLAVVPLVAPAMAVGLIALVVGLLVAAGLPTALGAVLAAPGWVILRILVSIVQLAADLPFASITLEPPWDSLAAGVAVLAIAMVIRSRRGTERPARKASEPMPAMSMPSSRSSPASVNAAQRAATGALIVAVAVTGGVLASRSGNIARITILDVGQGDAILVEGSRGGRLLVDGGPDPDRLLVALDRRVPPWDRRIDSVILSHPHEDHVAGLVLLLKRYDVATVFEVGMAGPGPGYGAWASALTRDDAPDRRAIAAGDRLRVDEVDLRVIWPRPGDVPDEPPDGGTGINNVSVVLAGLVGHHRFLLMGDVEEDIDPELLTMGLPRVDVLKVAHHGSRTATTQGFVDAVRPRIAVASAGVDNPYGHPTRQTLERLAGAGARVLRTDRDGSVTIGFMPGGITLRSEGATEVAPTPRPRSSAGRTGRVFRCSVPVTALIPEREVVGPSRPVRSVAVAARGGRGAIGYHRIDDRARAGGGRRPPAVPGSPTLARPAFARRRGDRWVAGRPAGGEGDGGGSSARRVCRPAPRRGQGTARRPPGTRAPPRRRLGGVADLGRPSRARARCVEPSRHSAARRSGVPALGGICIARGTDRGVRRQASRPTPRIARREVRVVATPVPARISRRLERAGHGGRSKPCGAA